jgi:hypothetical protein
MPLAERSPVDVPTTCPLLLGKKSTEVKNVLPPIGVGPATLLWRERRFPAKIIEASVDGFSFVVTREPDMNLGDHAALASAMTLTQIEIVSKTALDAQDRVTHRARHRFGARRLWNEPRNNGDETAEGLLVAWLQRSQATRGAAYNTILVVAALALLVGMSGAWLLYGRGTQRLDDDASEYSPANALAAKAKAAAEQPSAFWTWMTGGRATAAAGEQQVGRAVRSAAGTTASVGRSLADALGSAKLTHQQESAVHRVGKITDAALSALAEDGKSSAAEMAERRDKLLQAARQEVLRLLSAEQRAALEKGSAAP